MSITFPQPFGKYILLKKIAVGGMAEIFLAKSTGAAGFEKEVVIKRILPSFSEDEGFVTMFIDEARIVAKLHHANIVQIFDFSKIEECYYIAMEYVEGKDLRKIIDKGLKINKLLTPNMVVYIAIESAKGLHYAHSKTEGGKNLNIIHRDISPQNILISYNGEVKLTDFGIAKAAERSTKTRAGTVKGKCAYMSPEQARGKELDHRSDLFALGAVIWESLTYKRLFDGETDFEILSNVLSQEIPPPSSINPSVLPALDSIIMKTLARDKEKRYENAGDFLKDLQNYLFKYVESSDEINISSYLQDLFADEIKSLVELGELKTTALEIEKEKKPEPVIAEIPKKEESEYMTLLLKEKEEDKLHELETIAIDTSAEMAETIPVSELLKEVEKKVKGEVPSPHAQKETTILPSSEDLPPTIKFSTAQVQKRAEFKTSPYKKVPSVEEKRIQGKNFLFFISLSILILLMGGGLFYYFQSRGKQEGGGEIKKRVPTAVIEKEVFEDKIIAFLPEKEDIIQSQVEKGEPVKTAAVMVINVDPPMAIIQINGENFIGQKGKLKIEGKYYIGDRLSIVASMPDYNEKSIDYKVEKEYEELNIALEKITQEKGYGYITINARPWADVYLRGRSVGTTPIKSFKLMEGTYIFTLKNQTNTQVLKVKVKRGTHKTFVVDMQ